MKNVFLAVVVLAAGLGVGLLYSQVLSPVEYVDTAPDVLRGKDQISYIQLVARAYGVDGDLGRARTRLALLGLTDPAQTVTALAQRSAADGAPAGAVRALANLAAALGAGPATPTPPGAGPQTSTAGQAAEAGTPGPAPSALIATPTPSPGPPPTETVIPSITPRLLATRTPTATPLSAFDFIGRQLVCDPDLGQALIQVLAESSSGEAAPGVEVVVTWAGGFDHFFTGLKPDLGHGYGDFTMTPGIDYTLHLAESPALTIEGLAVETCTAPDGSTFPGSWLLVFRQP
ncbi:MAG: hypothetical protein IT318_09470 [Anaerolineales bacterium]|nr:hypothetical protein [Anaerolineales bacterium]